MSYSSAYINYKFCIKTRDPCFFIQIVCAYISREKNAQNPVLYGRTSLSSRNTQVAIFGCFVN